MYVNGAPEGLLCSDLTDEQKALFTDTRTWFDRGDSLLLYMNDVVMLADMALYYKNFTSSTHLSSFDQKSYGVFAERILQGSFFNNGEFYARPSSPPSSVMRKYPGWLADPVVSGTGNGPRSLLDVYDAYIQSVPSSGTADDIPFASNNSPLSFVFRTPFLVEPWRRGRGVGSPSYAKLPDYGFSSGPPSTELIVIRDLICMAYGHSSNGVHGYSGVNYSPTSPGYSGIYADPSDTTLTCKNSISDDASSSFSLPASFAFIDNIVHPITLPEEFGLTGDKVPSEWLGSRRRVLDKTVLSAAFSILGSGAWFSSGVPGAAAPSSSAHIGVCSCVGTSGGGTSGGGTSGDGAPYGGMPSVTVADFGESCQITNKLVFVHYSGDEENYVTESATVGRATPAYQKTACSFSGSAKVTFSSQEDSYVRRECIVTVDFAKPISLAGAYDANVDYKPVTGDADHLYITRAYLECPAGFSSRELYVPVKFSCSSSFEASVTQYVSQKYEKKEYEEWEDQYTSRGSSAESEAAGETWYAACRYIKFIPVGVVRNSGDAFPSSARRDDVVLWRSDETVSSLVSGLLTGGLVAGNLPAAVFDGKPDKDVIDDVFPDSPTAPAPQSPGDEYTPVGAATSYYSYTADARFSCSVRIGSLASSDSYGSFSAAGKSVSYGLGSGIRAILPGNILVTRFSFIPSKSSGGE